MIVIVTTIMTVWIVKMIIVAFKHQAQALSLSFNHIQFLAVIDSLHIYIMHKVCVYNPFLVQCCVEHLSTVKKTHWKMMLVLNSDLDFIDNNIQDLQFKTKMVMQLVFMSIKLNFPSDSKSLFFSSRQGMR